MRSRILWLAYVVVCLQAGMIIPTTGFAILFGGLLTYFVWPHVQLVQVQSFQTDKVRG